MDQKEITVDESREGERLDSLLASLDEELTRSLAQKIIEDGNVLINGSVAAKSRKVKCGDRICYVVPRAVPYTAQAEDIPLDIAYEDGDLLVVNKPKGMVVHPAAGNYGGTLVNALLAHCGDSLSGINGVMRPGIVHRIDKDTSGLLIVAKNDFAHSGLAEQIKAHSFLRVYQAVVYGHFKEPEGRIEAPIGRHPTERKKMAVVYKNSKPAATNYKVVASYEGFDRVSLRLETGRTHQIRVHMAYIGHPVAGDPVYGPKKVITSLQGQCLHAGEIGFIHPRTGEYIHLVSGLPEYFTEFLKSIGGEV
ncbi:MAG: RluA family pseudouridine synthase [Clostridia bacterium]|nr:RluA family pseudouridine synthase [Clostridia bacterium]